MVVCVVAVAVAGVAIVDADTASLCLQNNEQRKRVYQACACKLSYTFRRPLPHCVVAAVRTAWPAADWIYMGYQLTAASTATHSGFALADDGSDGSDDGQQPLPAAPVLPPVPLGGLTGSVFGGFGG